MVWLLLLFNFASLITIFFMKVQKGQKTVFKFRSHLLPCLDFAPFPSNSHNTQVSPPNLGVLSQPKSNKLNLHFLRDFVIIKDSFNIIKPSQEFTGIKFTFKLRNLNLMIIKVKLSFFFEIAPKTFRACSFCW